MTTKIKWYGPAYDKGLYKYTDSLMKNYSMRLESNTKSLVPVKSGALRDSISVTKVAQMKYKVGPTVGYGKYVEFGTSKTPARPFIRPAVSVTKGL